MIQERTQSPLAAWPWLLLCGWLAVAATQIWTLQREAVQRGEICTAVQNTPLWGDRR